MLISTKFRNCWKLLSANLEVIITNKTARQSFAHFPFAALHCNSYKSQQSIVCDRETTAGQVVVRSKNPLQEQLNIIRRYNMEASRPGGNEHVNGDTDEEHRNSSTNNVPDDKGDSDSASAVDVPAGRDADNTVKSDDDVIELSDNEEDKVTVSEVLIELDDNLKSKLLADLVQICEVEEDVARNTLNTCKWNMQEAIDFLLCANNSDDEEDDENKMDTSDADIPQTSSSPGEGASTSAAAIGIGRSLMPNGAGLPEICSPETDSRKEKEVEIERTRSPVGISSWAPEKFSVMSWNLDGLDDKNLEKRTDYVINLVEKEKHDILFFQELLPYTFDYIARRLISTYHPIPGTEDSSCEYLTATFLRKNSVHYEDHFVMPFPNSLMGRTLLVTKAFIGRAKLALLNSHLESTAEFAAQRTTQLKTAFEVASTFDKEYNVIFGGDLNLRDKEVEGNLPRSMSDLWVHCGSRKTCQYTWDLTRNTNKQMPSKFQPKCRFDRFYFRGSEPATLNPEFFGVTGIEKVPETQSFPSDHWAIISFFALSKEARKPAPKKRKAENDVFDD